MNEWSNLPNAAHIDRVLASLKSHPEAWSAARYAAWSAARDAARDAAWSAAMDADGDAARDAAWSAARDAARDAARYAARDAISALIAWDTSAKYLDMSSDKLEVWAHLSDDPAAHLMLPAVVVFEQIEQLVTA